MSIHARLKIADLMEEHPEVDEVLENYGIEVSDEIMAMTLKELCREEGINYWELKSDMVEAVGWDGSAEGNDDEEEDEDEDWLDDDDDEGGVRRPRHVEEEEDEEIDDDDDASGGDDDEEEDGDEDFGDDMGDDEA